MPFCCFNSNKDPFHSLCHPFLKRHFKIIRDITMLMETFLFLFVWNVLKQTGIYFNWVLNVLKLPLLFIVFLLSSYGSAWLSGTIMMMMIIIQGECSPD